MGKVVFTFDDMIASLRKAMKTFPDKRTGKNTQYGMLDAAAGAFSVFFTQCPSFLEHQKLMQQRYGLSNARTLFGIKDIPSDNHIRNLLDETQPSLLSSVFDDCFTALKRNGDLNYSFRVPLGKNSNDLLIAIDGTTYFSSSTITCKNCSKRTKDGETLFTHSMITPTIVAPGVNKVISMAPEFIIPQDGDSKQDCELKASKRWVSQCSSYSSENVTILGDDLYAHEPFCRDLLEKGFNFILVCKPESHKTLYEWVKGITMEKIIDSFDGKSHILSTYTYVEGVPLKDGKDSLFVNFVEVKVKDRKTGKQIYHNAFVTNHPLTDKTIETIVSAGRARWKIENENNNTLKRQGYHLEHNFGHGNKYLASILAMMNILSFLFHTMLEFMNQKYQLLRKVLGARKRFFEHIRVLLIHVCCRNFDHFMDFMIEGLKKPHDLETLRFPV